MAAPSGEDVASILLRALPPDAAEAVLAQLGPAGDRLRTRLLAGPPSNDELDAALTAFFDVQRIADRPPGDAPPAGEYRPVSNGGPVPSPKPAEDVPEEPEEAPPPDPMKAIRWLSPDRLARVLDGEPPSAVALILASIDPAAAGTVLKLLPQEVRAEVGMRLTQPAPRNPALLEQLARAVADKGRTLKRLPPEPTEDDRILKLADMLRAIPRPDRQPVLQRIEAADQELAAKVRERLYRIEDLLKVPDRPLQSLLTELDVKTIATALKGVPDEIKGRVTQNMSSRSREVLKEEMDLLGAVPTTRVKEKQAEVLALLRKHEEEGKITLDD